MANPKTSTKQLLDAIVNAGVRVKVGLIIDLCVDAVGNLDSIDQGIFQRAQDAAAKGAGGLSSMEDLNELAATVLGGVRALVSYLESSDADAGFSDVDADAGCSDADADAGVDFDFDLSGPAPDPTEVSLDDDDIAGVLDGFAPKSQRSGDERWAALSTELTSFSYALSAQLDDFDQRFAGALEQGRVPQALRELDDVSNALIDGVFALMSTIYETYLDAFDRDQMLPGHRDALGKALLVRRGVADLRRAVKALNPSIQDAKAPDEDRKAGVHLLAAELSTFVESEVWGVMRPGDRLELQNFREEIAGDAFRRAALSCEGLDKYLDSLLSVNQRDVLIRHDRARMSEIVATLEGVGPIVDISPHGAMALVRQAFDEAAALYGYHDLLDDLLAEWKTTVSQSTEPAVMVEISERLAAITTGAM
ncbi:MAG: hypothetical protein JRH20_11900 [Deltaproteobacteria bacterium]|nr:hypothetical protein [Deltaproteobacteria bacterium]